MTDINRKIQERKQLYLDALNFQNKRTPYTMWAWEWKITSSEQNITIEDATINFDLQEKALREFYDKYEFDTINCRSSLYNTKLNNALGGTCGRVMNGNFFNNLDRNFLEASDVDEFIKSPTMHIWKKAGPKYHPDLTFGNILDAIEAKNEHTAFSARMNKMVTEEYGLPRHLPSPSFIIMPIEYHSLYSGLKQFSIDLRRHPGAVESVMNYYEPIFEHQLSALQEAEDDVIFDTGICFLAHSLMNMKQFEKYFWPHVKRYFDRVTELGLKCNMHIEAETIRFADYFNDLPKGKFCIHPEMEDVQEIRKAMPNLSIEGGLPISILNSVSPQKSADFTKALIDSMGNGFILSHYKMLNYPNDAKKENMLAIQNVVYNY